MIKIPKNDISAEEEYSQIIKDMKESEEHLGQSTSKACAIF